MYNAEQHEKTEKKNGTRPTAANIHTKTRCPLRENVKCEKDDAKENLQALQECTMLENIRQPRKNK